MMTLSSTSGGSFLVYLRLRQVSSFFGCVQYWKNCPWPDWYAQYMLDEARLQILLSGKPVRVSGMVDRFGRRLPECEAYRGIADFDSRKLFLLFQASPGRKFCVITSLDDMTFIPYG